MTRGAGFGAGASRPRRRRQAGSSAALDLNFAASDALDSRVTFTRASSATRFNSAGTLVTMTNNQPRFDYNPSTLAARGLLIEEARTNLFLNSTIDGANLATQTVTVAAVANTISFYGTGMIALTGAHTATINGSGAFPTRTTLTFTPTAGALICTVTGTVQYANIEAGAFATSFIPTAGATVTRAIDSASMTGTNFSSWYNETQGSFVAAMDTFGVAPVYSGGILDFNGVSSTMSLGQNGTGSVRLWLAFVGPLADVAGLTVDSPHKAAFAYATADYALSLDGSAVATSSDVTVRGAVNTFRIGHAGNGPVNGHIKRITYYNTRKTNAELQSLSI